jgi:hypothetical protein
MLAAYICQSLLSTYGVNSVTDTRNIRAPGELQLRMLLHFSKLNSTWCTTSQIQDFMERAEHTPTFFLL